MEATAMSMPPTIKIEAPTQKSMAPYGWVLGKPFPSEERADAFRNSTTGFWREHIFDAGDGGEVEILWVEYRNVDPFIGQFEKHFYTQQAVVPLTGNITQIVALNAADGTPDLSSVRAYRISPGIGLCMRPGVWHATRGKAATCLMLTRRSTTLDLVKTLNGGDRPSETSLQDVTPIRLIQSRRKSKA